MKRPGFSTVLPRVTRLTFGDVMVFVALTGILYVGTRLALRAPAVVAGPEISLDATALPWYAALSLARMSAAYALSLVFSLAYGYYAARNRRAGQVMIPLLDVLQSVPILSFLPVVLLSLSVLLSSAVAAELAAVVLIFTSQAWNLTFSVYQSTRTVPGELREAAAVFRFGAWFRLKYVELPFAANGLVWNSVMSWAGGWFFLMAAEMFTVGSRDFRLPGLGSYLSTAAQAGDLHALGLGVATMIAIVVALDQLLWRPLLAWAQRFKLETVEGEHEPQSWFHDQLARAWLVERFLAKWWAPFMERLDRRWQIPHAPVVIDNGKTGAASRDWRVRLIVVAAGIGLLYLALSAGRLLATLPLAAWRDIAIGLGATLLRVTAALLLAAAWTIPVGVAIGTRPRLAAVLQPVAQVAASVPATALFPILLLALLHLPGGLNLAAVLLMLLGSQWYLLFNVIAGASAIPRDLRDTTALLRLSPVERWRTLLLPALFPYVVTGAITAVGGAWNASVVAEYVQFGGETHATLGIGAVISHATATGDFALLLAATLAMVVTVVLLNRLFWQPLYRLAEARYRME
ncbi:MAG: ABC transporter permease [Thiobacillus sp. 63-78]|uniref:ABC transporter permease n=1 Tax=Thiobacillus sp. 63-78 TaxID=1895859 RepID=UPI000969D331|nr:ABC transporter permease subunit [Thiobacillus sp. 63-78]MBN8763160.1 ABC transporter permease subunit [Thiobacillus sp.]MBN8773680.1 ABC transporter permease subunit [Thiobacillus sp.]OJZ12754.1 MAG: ABC transporter permease [Thiobacillus sp. 63-78]